MTELVTGDQLEAGDTIVYPPIGGKFVIVKMRSFCELSPTEEEPRKSVKLFGVHAGRRVERWVVIDTRESYERVEVKP